jgi:isoleucyl-tRNA synthetase
VAALTLFGSVSLLITPLALFPQPLKELVVFHHDPEYLADVKALESYIQDEMNVFELTLTSEEQRMGIKYKANAEWAVLGKKLRKDLARVKKALPDLASDDVKQYAQSGEISVDGIPLQSGDLTVTRYVDSEDKDWASNTDEDAVILLDIRLHPELQEHFLRRELTTRCQRLRKVAGLQPTDQVDIFYQFTSGMEDALKEVVQGHEEAFSKKVGATPQPLPTNLSAKILGQYPPKAEGAVDGEGDAVEQDTSSNGYVLYAVSK